MGSGLDDFAAAEAGGADAHALGGGADAGVNGAQVNIPAALGHVVGVGDAVSELRLFAADFTLLSHDGDRSFQRGTRKLLLYGIARGGGNE